MERGSDDDIGLSKISIEMKTKQWSTYINKLLLEHTVGPLFIVGDLGNIHDERSWVVCNKTAYDIFMALLFEPVSYSKLII